MLLKACARCGNLIPYGSTYCKTCILVVEAEREARLSERKKESNRLYNKSRDPKYVKFYNSAQWKAMSAKRLQDDGYRCAFCGEIATEVDHIIPIRTPEGWEKRYDYNNTRSLCHRCHDKRHNRFQSRGRAAARKR